MASTDLREAQESVRFAEFGGIGAACTDKAIGASDMRNFRIRSDGTLEKRCGFRTLFSLNAPLRGTWEGTVDGSERFFAVGGNTVYQLSLADGTASARYVLSTSEGEVSFFYYRDVLYLTDGSSLLRFRSNLNTFTVAEGYTPLYGRNWHPTQLGEVNEARNLLQNRIRIHYLNTTGSTVFRLPYTPKRIEGLRVGGTPVTTYTLNVASASFEIPSSLATGGEVEVAVTLDDVFDRRATTVSAKRVCVYRDPHHETVFAHGGDIGYALYRSAAVTEEMQKGSDQIYSAGDALYLPEDARLTVGSAQDPVTALLQSGEQLLAMNRRSLWAIRHLDDATDETRIYLLSSGGGCLSEGGALACGKSTVTVRESGVSSLTFPSNDPDTFEEKHLSEEIDERLGAEQLSRSILHFDGRKNELWLRDSQDEEGLVRVCELQKGRWTCFDGIHAVCFFTYRGAVGFGTSDGRLCLMDDALDGDDGKAFEAYYLSQYLSFSHPAFQKRSLYAALCADSVGGTLCLSLETERASHDFPMQGSAGVTPELFERRLSPGRFRFLRFRVTAVGTARSKIRSLSLAASY